MARNSGSINLLPRDNEGLFTQFLNWALTIGRLLIILTETVALATFLYRFGLDRQLIDLHDKIKNESFIVQHFKDYEALYRSLQHRLVLTKQYDTQSGTTPKVFRDVIEMGRGYITFKTIIVSDSYVKVEAQARSVNALGTFVDALKKYPGISSVSIDKVENKTSDAIITLGVTGGLKNAPTPTPSIIAQPRALQQQGAAQNQGQGGI